MRRGRYQAEANMWFVPTLVDLSFRNRCEDAGRVTDKNGPNE